MNKKSFSILICLIGVFGLVVTEPNTTLHSVSIFVVAVSYFAALKLGNGL